jgi:hypothetical protein
MVVSMAGSLDALRAALRAALTDDLRAAKKVSKTAVKWVDLKAAQKGVGTVAPKDACWVASKVW